MSRAATFDVNSLNVLRNTQKAQTPEGVKQIARQYETLFLQTMMKTLRATVPQDGLLSSDAQKTYTGLLDQEFASMMADTRGGIGFAKAIEKQLARQMGVEMNSSKSGESAAGDFQLLENAQNFQILEKAESAQSKRSADATSLNIFTRFAPESPNVEITNACANFENTARATVFSPLFEIATLLNASKSVSEESEKELPWALENQKKSENFSAKPSEIQSAQPEVSEKNNLPEHARAFIRNVWADAQSAAQKTGLNAAHIVAHAALESGWGKHQPGADSFNLFGIKANRAWDGKRVVARTTEFENGAAVSKFEEFRAYDSYRDAFLDYAEFLQKNPRYAQVLSAQNGNDFAQNLQKAGYATDPNYAEKLQRTIARTQEFLNI